MRILLRNMLRILEPVVQLIHDEHKSQRASPWLEPNSLLE